MQLEFRVEVPLSYTHGKPEFSFPYVEKIAQLCAYDNGCILRRYQAVHLLAPSACGPGTPRARAGPREDTPFFLPIARTAGRESQYHSLPAMGHHLVCSQAPSI